MAKNRIEVDVVGDASKFKRSLGEAGSSVDSFSGTIKKLVGVFAGMAVVDKVKDGIVNVTKAAIDENREIAVLAETIENNTTATQAQIDANENWITSTQNLYAVSDEKLRPALGKLLASTKDLDEAQKLLNISLDVATARGLDVETVALAVQKAHDGTMSGLGRLGIAYKDAEGKALSFDDAMQRAVATYGGTATTAAQETAGKIDILSFKLADLKETLGNAFVPVVNKMTGPLGKLVDKAGELAKSFADIAQKKGIFEALKTSIKKAGEEFSKWGSTVDWSKVAGGIAGAVRKAVTELAPVALKVVLDITEQGAKETPSAALSALKETWGTVTDVLSAAKDKVLDGLVATGKWIGVLKVIGGEAVEAITKVTDAQNLDNTATIAAEQLDIRRARSTEARKQAQERLTKQLEEQTRREEDLARKTELLVGLYEEAVSPTDVWSETIKASAAAAEEAGKQYQVGEQTLESFLQEMQNQISNWENFQTNLEKLAKEWGPEFGADVIMEASKIGPDFVAALVGSDDPKLVADSLAALKMTLQQNQGDLADSIIAVSEVAGAAGGKAAWNAWLASWYALASLHAPSQIYGTSTPDYMAAPGSYAHGGLITAHDHTATPRMSGEVPIVAHEGEYVLTVGDTNLMKNLTSAINSQVTPADELIAAIGDYIGPGYFTTPGTIGPGYFASAIGDAVRSVIVPLGGAAEGANTMPGALPLGSHYTGQNTGGFSGSLGGTANPLSDFAHSNAMANAILSGSGYSEAQKEWARAWLAGSGVTYTQAGFKEAGQARLDEFYAKQAAYTMEKYGDLMHSGSHDSGGYLSTKDITINVSGNTGIEIGRAIVGALAGI